ncbi:MAG: glycosyltransferase family 1 protein [Actinomycetia bacterium]|nr:glycosyltransferase family 1 protein [Actinomycetes bacterium]
MRVAIVSECFLPVINGVTNSVLRVVEHLGACGHDVLVVAPGMDGPTRYLGARVVRIPAVDLPVVSSMPVGVPSRRVLTALREFRPDVVHLAAPFVVGYRGLVAARRLGVPTVAIYQTDVAGFASSYGLGLTARAAWRWACRLHSQADRTLAPSTWATAELRARGVPRVYQWARGVDTSRFTPAKRDPGLRARLARDGELLVGYVGRLAPEKQVERLSALHGMAGVRLVVVGDGPSMAGLRKALPDARFLGFRDGDDLARVVASLDVFVHTGPSETFCQAVQEALASGVPVVAPDAGGPRDLVLPGRTGYLVPPRPEGVAPSHPACVAADEHLRAAVAALADPGLRCRFGAAARRSVLRRTWSAVCDELVVHYAEVLGRPTIPARAA